MKIKVREQILRPPAEVFATLSRPDMFLSRWSRGVLAVTAVKNNAQIVSGSLVMLIPLVRIFRIVEI